MLDYGVSAVQFACMWDFVPRIFHNNHRTLPDHIVCLSGDVAFARTELYRDSVVV